MKNKLVYKITEENDGVHLINFLKYEIKMSTRLTRKLVHNGYVKLNGGIARNRNVLKVGDVIDITLPSNETQDIEPEDIPIDVVYEDADLLVVNKPPFMVVHPTKGHPNGTLANAVVNYFRKTNQDCIVRLVNRLDRDTSGLIIIAKSQFAHQAMARKLQDNAIQKYYIAVVNGVMEGSGTIDLPIDRPSIESIKRQVMEGGQRAITHYEVLDSGENMSKVLVRLETGKTHQIRVHMSHIGHPIIGDSLYGEESSKIDRQALHAYKLKFNSIRDDKILEITADIPEDIKKILNIIESDK